MISSRVQPEHLRDDRGRGDLDQHDVVEADAVEAVLERDARPGSRAP